MSNAATDEKIKEAVRQAYGSAASCCIAEPVQASCCCRPSQTQASSCCPTGVTAKTEDSDARLYSDEELASRAERTPAVAGLQPDEVVLDLGSGAGLECILAARKVGPGGRAIGLDMTPEMLKLARRNAKQAGVTNVEFNWGEIEDIPLPDGAVDVIISNCVINLSPDKDAVFAQAYRVLRPGGRLDVSDIVLDGKLPQPIRDSMAAWAGCVAGALPEPEYLDKVRAAGFTDVEVLSREYVQISQVSDWGLVRTALAQASLPLDALDRTVVSARVRARKPA